MDFCHLIVTCLFSKLRLPFDNQKVKENYAIFFKKTLVFWMKDLGLFFKLFILFYLCLFSIFSFNRDFYFYCHYYYYFLLLFLLKY